MLANKTQLKKVCIVSTSEEKCQELESYLKNKYQLEVSSSLAGTGMENLLNRFSDLIKLDRDISSDDLVKMNFVPDLIIIESKHEQSLQDALILEASYAELFFVEKLDEEQLDIAIADFHERKRNFGA